MESYQNNKEEIYLLLLMATAGALVLVYSHHMASFFIGLELLSVPVYGMIAYTHERGRSLEAGIKYLVLSASASAFMLFGMALMYAQTGTLAFFGFMRHCRSHRKQGAHASIRGNGIGHAITKLPRFCHAGNLLPCWCVFIPT